MAKLKLSEADVTAQIKGYMESWGWQAYRMQSGVVRGLTRGTFMKLNTAGTPDWLFTRGRDYLFVEIKAPGKKMRPSQENWFAIAKMRGTPALVVDSLQALIEGLKTV